jgi:phage internal scaffolding protein
MSFRTRKFVPKIVIDCSNDVPIVQQSFKNDCDINVIISRHSRGLSSHVRSYDGFYGDFSGIQDFHSALRQVESSRDMFMSLPSSIRSRFNNDPGQFLDFVNNPSNSVEVAKMGLLNPEATKRILDNFSANSGKNSQSPAPQGGATGEAGGGS